MRVTLLLLFFCGFVIQENLAYWPPDPSPAPCTALGALCIDFSGCDKGNKKGKCVLEDFTSL